jgi:agmatinase
MNGGAGQVIENIARATQGIVELGGFPVGLGGENTVTLGVINGLLDAGVKDIGVVQIDAHTDLREAYEGNPFSHASVMKRIIDKGIPLLQLGVRSFCEEERDIRLAHNVYHFDAEELVSGNVCEIQMPLGFPENVFFTLDVDGMDPSVFPSTGTPVPGVLLWYQTLGLFESVAKQRNIIGFDVTEFAPIEGFHCYEFSAAILVYKMMGIVERKCF